MRKRSKGKRRKRKRGKKWHPKGLKVSPYLNHGMNISINVEGKKNEEKKA